MANIIRIELENDEDQVTRWEYVVHDLVRSIELKQMFYKALSERYGLDVITRLGNGKTST